MTKNLQASEIHDNEIILFPDGKSSIGLKILTLKLEIYLNYC